MEEKLPDEKLPPSYINLGFDADSSAGPSAPTINEELGASGADDEPQPGPSALRNEDPEINLKEPTAPSFETNTEPPPSYFEHITEPATLKYTKPTLLFEDIYEACILYVKKNCCYSSKFVKEMKLTEIINGCAFYYTLESYGEKRASADLFRPYKGGPIDGPANGPPPDPWDMSVCLPTLFKDHKAQVPIPHTDYIKVCAKCSGSGKVRCWSCGGTGRDSCFSCSGTGRKDGRSCHSCGGRGKKTCFRCGGSGRVTCSKCDGYGKIKCSKVLILTWTNHMHDFVSDVRKLPAKKIQKASGDAIFREQKDQLHPIMNAPDPSVNAASSRLIASHRNSFSTEIIRKQRHNLRAVPFTIAKYTWKELEGEFYIYGKDKDVYFDDYPTDCCCCTCS